MNSLAALALSVSFVVWIAAQERRLGLRRIESRLRALWTWRHGREHAAMCGVIDC